MSDAGTIALLGAGLMGSSLGLALKARGAAPRIHLYARRETTRNDALERGVADAVFDDPVEAVRGVECAVLCVPVCTIAPLAKACLPGLEKGTVLTDVGSTKQVVQRQMDDVLAGSPARFIGSHPICGSEQQGMDAARPDLYEGAMTVVTPQDDAPEEDVRRVSALWQSVGSTVRRMSAQEHDRVLAMTSHLPHLASAALVLSAGGDGSLCGTGFRDTTRLAAGSPEVWRDILTTNRDAVGSALEGYIGELAALRALLNTGDGDAIESWLCAAAARRVDLLR